MDDLSSVFAGLSARASEPTPDPIDSNRKRLHIHIQNGQMTVAVHGFTEVRRVVRLVWSVFGQVTDHYYPENLSYCFLSFGSHAEAAAAMEGINDPERLRAAVESAIHSQMSAAARDHAKGITESIFSITTASRGGSRVRASWAAPRSNTRHYDSYGHKDDDDCDDDEDYSGTDDDCNYGDDCPHGCDKGEWAAYCESRSSP